MGVTEADKPFDGVCVVKGEAAEKAVDACRNIAAVGVLGEEVGHCAQVVGRDRGVVLVVCGVSLVAVVA